MSATTTPISQNWSYKERDPSIASVLDEINASWTNTTSFPSEVHVELLKAGRIPDPFLGDNEHQVQCEYLPSVVSEARCFEGLLTRDIFRDRRQRVAVPHQVRRLGEGACLQERGARV